MEYVVAPGAAEITDPRRAIVFKLWSWVARYKPTTDVFWAMVPSIRAVASKNDCSNNGYRTLGLLSDMKPGEIQVRRRRCLGQRPGGGVQTISSRYLEE